MFISTLINLSHLNFSTFPNQIGSYLSYCTLAACLAFPFLLMSLIKLKKKGTISSKEFEAKYGTIIFGLKAGNEGYSQYWSVILMVK
jgi:hypothetical protein